MFALSTRRFSQEMPRPGAEKCSPTGSQVEPAPNTTADARDPNARVSLALDVLVAAVLLVVAYQVRRRGLPTNGLWLDDAYEVAASKTSLRGLFTVGGDHPGFIALLMVLRDLGARSDASFAYPALVAGTIAPPLLFVALRSFGFARSISALLSAALAAAQVDIIYSGRVKTHVIDAVVVLGIAVLVPYLTKKRWRLSTAVVWICVALLAAWLTGFGLLAVAVAGIVIVMNPVGDFMLRSVAVAVQEAACAVLYLVERGTYNGRTLERQWRRTWDGFPSLSPNSVLTHLGRVAETFPGGPPWLARVVIVVGVVGLSIEAANGRRRVLARYLLLVLVVAVMGGLVGVLPFGPKSANALASGQRLSIWLAPVVAIGLAFALQRLLESTAGLVRWMLHAAAYVGALAILVSALGAMTWRYPFPGARSATSFVESNLGPRDALVVPANATYTLAAESSFAASAVAQPRASIGYRPRFADRRILNVGTTAAVVRAEAPNLIRRTTNTPRVFVYLPEPPFNAAETASRQMLATALREGGFVLRQSIEFDTARVDIWAK